MFRFLNTLLLFALLATTAHAALTPERLRCEYLENPLGIDATIPRLSWIVTSSEVRAA